MDYFNNQMKMAGLSQTEGDPIIACQVNLDKNYAFLEVSKPFMQLVVYYKPFIKILYISSSRLFTVPN